MDIFRGFRASHPLDTVNQWPYELALVGPVDSKSGREGGMFMTSAQACAHGSQTVRHSRSPQKKNSIRSGGSDAVRQLCEGSTK